VRVVVATVAHAQAAHDRRSRDDQRQRQLDGTGTLVLERLRLRDRARKAVEQRRPAELVELIEHHLEHDRVGYQAAGLDPRSDMAPDLRAAFDLVS
jgi:hypothetical protein